MLSAFGVDHGEISKASRAIRRGPNGKRLTRAQQRTRGQGVPSGPQKISGALHRVGEADISLKNVGGGAGRALQGTGRFLANRPGLTGTAIVGGGSVAGYKYLSDKQPKKKS